ncbi:MAG: DUF87 domain-containing protein [Trueperaceae bacterium]
MDFEKLGAFYLGREVDPETLSTTDRPLLYDANDLTTHAVIVGMTGSGKTGLGIGLIEEAAIDGVPVLAIDPKGDLGNLALTFPELRADDFAPWVDPQAAERKGQDVAAYAADQAETWRRGLADWGQGPERIVRLREAAEVVVFTPGSSAGRPVSVLRSFAAPPVAVRDDPDLFADRIDAAATGLLTLLGVDADPLGREHVLLATILGHAWRAGQSLGVGDLIHAVQDPPVKRIGVMDIDTVFPAKDRMKLALALNTLLAAPSFQAWLQGEPLDVQSLLYRSDGKPRIAVVSISHLSDAERMFFLTLLLSEVVAWTRSQTGTSSLRALVYVDELFGFLPPVAEPPTKRPLLTLLKQARAFGVGLALATQNPVDLDYKALSNAGTWFVGRLQTERDKQRLVDGLSSAAPSAVPAAELTDVIGRLGKRTFLLHNVHEGQPALFQTRWVMSYLAGPLSREQIRRLSASTDEAADGEAAEGAVRQATPAQSAPAAAGEVATTVAGPAGHAASGATAGATTGDAAGVATDADARPYLPPNVRQAFAPADAVDAVRYFPFLLGAADVHYSSKTYGVDVGKRVERVVEPREGPIAFAWAESEAAPVALDATSPEPTPGLPFVAFPAIDVSEKRTKEWEALFQRWLRTDGALTLYRHPATKLVSDPDEPERDFAIRCAHRARELRDAERAALRKKYEAKLATLERRVMRDSQTTERERQQLQQRTLDSAVTVGTALLGAFLGRRSASRVSTAVRRASSVGKESGDVNRARETLARSQAELAALQSEFDRELAALPSQELHPDVLELETVRVRPTSSDIALRYVGVLWIPHRQGADGRWHPAVA